MLKTRAGFTLVEVLVALTMTAVIGAAATGAFISQSQFFDKQEKVGAARSVARGGMNMIMSEMRMVERSGGVVAATNSAVTLRLPYALGLFCKLDLSNMRLSMLPSDPSVFANAGYSGYAVRTSANTYAYTPTGAAPNTDGVAAADCGTPGITVLPGAQILNVPFGVVSLTPGTPVLLYQTVTYEFKASTSVSGRIGLFRRMHNPPPSTPPADAEEELLAPFDTTAMFRFYVSDGATAQTAPPGVLSNITGLEVRLDGLSERPNSDGTFQRVPLKTSVFFRNR